MLGRLASQTLSTLSRVHCFGIELNDCAYMQAQARYMDAVEKFGSMKGKVDGLLSSREDAYLGLLAVPDPGEAYGRKTFTDGLTAVRMLRFRTLTQYTYVQTGMAKASVLALIHPSYPKVTCVQLCEGQMADLHRIPCAGSSAYVIYTGLLPCRQAWQESCHSRGAAHQHRRAASS